MKYFKLTNKQDKTTNDTQWGENITHKATGVGNSLCSNDVIHVYDHPLKAVMFNPTHASFGEYLLWECKVRKVVASDGLKVGVKQCTTIKRIPAPEITTAQRACFAILCALEFYQEDSFVAWANRWLSGEDRTVGAAEAAAMAAEAAAGVVWDVGAALAAREAAMAARTDDEAATWIVEAERAAREGARAARVAESATRAAEAAAIWAAEVAMWTVEGATRVAGAALASRATAIWAAEVAIWAAEVVKWTVEAEMAAKKIDFVSLIKKAMKEVKE